MKRLGSFLMALILCAALAPPAFAAGDNAEQDDVIVENVGQGVVTIENAEAGDEYKFYQILVPDGSGGYDVSETWEKYTIPLIKVEGGSVFYLNKPGHPEDGWTEIKDSDPTSVGMLLFYARDDNTSITPVDTITVTEESGTVQATLDYGYYLLDYGNKTGGLFYLDSSTKKITKKTETEPSLKKEIVLANGEKADWTTVQLGDEVRFEVTVKLPSAKEWADSQTSYSCKIYDKVTSGLRLNKNVEVKIDEEIVIDGTELDSETYIVTGKCGETDADTIHLHYSDDLKSFNIAFGAEYDKDGSVGGTLEFLKLHPGAELTLSYTATVIQYSEETPYEVNTVHLQYGKNDIYDDVQMYDFTIVIEKIDKDTGEFLGGAKFVLENKDGLFYCSDRKLDNSYHAGDKVEWLKATYDSDTGNFTPADPTKLDSMVLNTTVKGTDGNNWNGKNHFEGIPAGTYRLYEIEAPDGYDRLTDPIEIVIRPRVTQLTDGSEKVTYTEIETYEYVGLGTENLNFNRVVFESIIDGKTPDIEAGKELPNIEAGDVPWGGTWNQLRLTVGVENSKDTFHLPSTGGMGTTIFYAVGGVLLVGAAVLLAAKRRTDGMD